MKLSRRAVLATAMSPIARTAAAGPTATVPQGLWPVMLTPFKADKSIDWSALDALTEWYLQNGADGLFACCQSSEVWDLTEQERIQIATRVVKRSGRIPVVAGGLPGFEPNAVGEYVGKLADFGVQAAVLTTCQVAQRDEQDSVWRERVEKILAAAENMLFGLYEAPRPYKRLLSPETMRWAARTNRFVFHKDTSCNIDAIFAKVKAVGGTQLRIFNAHVPILIDAIRTGGHGFSGIAANAYPNVVSFAVHHQADQPARAEKVQAFLTEGEKTLNINYPLSAKVMAALAGLPIEPVCRKVVAAMTPDQMESLRALRKSADALLS